MAQTPLGPPPPVKQDAVFDRWIRMVYQRIVSAGQIIWSQIDFTGSTLTDLVTRNHADLQNLNTASYTHLTATNHTDLTDGGDSTLHYHAADRARANQTGTQTLSTISDAGTIASQNANSVTITGGAIDGTTIGGTTAGAGTFTTLSSTGNTTLGDASADSLTINAGTWTYGSDITATRAIGTAAAGNVVPNQHVTTIASGDSGGTTAPAAYARSLTIAGSYNYTTVATDNVSAVHDGTGTATNFRSFSLFPQITNSGAVTTLTGLFIRHILSSSGGATTAVGGDVFAPILSSTGAIGTNIGLRARDLGHATLVTNAVGFDAENMTASITLTAAFRSQMNSGTGKWGFYASGTADNALKGNTRFGSVVAPTVACDVTGAVLASATIKSSGATSGIGYATGAGGTVTQATSRTTGVTINKVCGAITLVSAAGSTSWQSFTVTNSTVAATDTIIVNQKSGTDKNMIHVTAVAAGSFEITFATTGGTTTEQPVFNFSVIKAVTS